MAQIQFLNGTRDGEAQTLDEEYSLTVGTSPSAQVRVADQGVDPEHALIYSVAGQFYVMTHQNSQQNLVVVNSRKIPPGAAGATAIQDKDIILIGRTLVAKFWRTNAPTASAAPAAAASAADPKVAKERDEFRSQLEQAKRDLEAANREKTALAETSSAFKREKGELESAKDTLSKQVKRLEEESGKKDEDLASAKKRADAAEADLAQSKPALAAKDAELETLRRAVEALRSAESQAKRDRRPALREGSDLGKALAALVVPDAIRDRIASAVRDEVDREVLSREGPVVPLRGLRCPGCDLDMEAELSSLKSRRKHKGSLRALGIAALSPEEIDALLAKAKG